MTTPVPVHSPAPVPVPVPAPAPAPAPVQPEAVTSIFESISQTFSSAWETTTAVPGKLYDAMPTVCGDTCKSVSTTVSGYFETVTGTISGAYTSTITAITPAQDSVIRTAADYSSSAFQTIAPVVAGGVIANSSISMLQGKANIELKNPEMKKALIATATAGLAIYLNSTNEGRYLQLASLLAASTAVGIYKAYTAVAPIYIMLPEGISFEETLVEDGAEVAAETVAAETQTSVQEEKEVPANS